MIVLRISTET